MNETIEKAPKDFQALRALIAQRADTLPKRLAQVATYALENPDEIAFGTAASIAAAESSINHSVRFMFCILIGQPRLFVLPVLPIGVYGLFERE